MTLINDFSRIILVYILKLKDEAFSTFINWKIMIKHEIKKNIKCVKTNNGLEFFNHGFNDFCSKKDIMRHHTYVGILQ